MIIGHVSDLHNRHKQVVLPKKLDVIICSGDISGRGRQSEVTGFFKWWKSLSYQYKILVAGNHDLCFDPDINGYDKDEFLPHYPDWLRDQLEEYRETFGHYYLENEGVEIEGVKFWGSPISPTFGHGWAFNKDRGKSIKEVWDKIPFETDVLITHGPVKCHVDYVPSNDYYAGCDDLRNRIKAVKPLLHLSGHIHESYGYSYDQDTHYFNGCICNLHYEAVNAPWIIDANFKEREIKILNHESKSKEDSKPEREEHAEYPGGENV